MRARLPYPNRRVKARALTARAIKVRWTGHRIGRSAGGRHTVIANVRTWHTFPVLGPVLGGGRVRQLSGIHLPCAHRCQTGEIWPKL